MFLAARTWSSRHEHTQQRDYNHRKFLPAQWSSHQNYASGVNQHSSENTSYGLDSRLDIELDFLLRIFLPTFLEDTREAFGKIMLVLMEDETLSMAMLEDEIMMVTPRLPSWKNVGWWMYLQYFPNDSDTPRNMLPAEWDSHENRADLLVMLLDPTACSSHVGWPKQRNL